MILNADITAPAHSIAPAYPAQTGVPPPAPQRWHRWQHRCTSTRRLRRTAVLLTGLLLLAFEPCLAHGGVTTAGAPQPATHGSLPAATVVPAPAPVLLPTAGAPSSPATPPTIPSTANQTSVPPQPTPTAAGAAPVGETADIDLYGLPRGDAERPAYPKNWAFYLERWHAIGEKFRQHIAGARNIRVPTGKKEFDWAVDWAKQQAFCKAMVQTIFHEPHRWQPALPNVIAARDGVTAVHQTLDTVFPKCRQPPPTSDERLSNLMARRSARPSREQYLWLQSRFEPAHWLGKDDTPDVYLLRGLYFADDHFIETTFLTEPSDSSVGLLGSPILFWFGFQGPHPETHCPASVTGGSKMEMFDPRGDRPYIPTIMLKINDAFVPVEFGVYGPAAPERNDQGLYRWGQPGQGFVFIRSLRHRFWSEWARKPGAQSDPELDENHETTGAYRACIVNFDLSAQALQTENQTSRQTIRKPPRAVSRPVSRPAPQTAGSTSRP